MKKITLWIVLFSFIAHSQKEKSIDTVKVFIETDVNFASSSNDTRKEASSGIGTLGLKFERGIFYGDINFTVFSQNKLVKSQDSIETKIFGSNLLLPQNSSSNISNFFILFGVKSFYKILKDDEPTLSWKRFGANASFRINNSTWVKDSIQSAVTIASNEFNLTYLLLNTQLFNTKEKIKIITSIGYTRRAIGGDLGLDSNKDERIKYVKTENLSFHGLNIGTRLEISKFYGQMNLTSFKRSENIVGFSGDQAIITLGIKADLSLFGKEVSAENERILKLEKEIKIKELVNKLKTLNEIK